MMNAAFYVRGRDTFTYGPLYHILEAKELAAEIDGWVEDENGLKVNFV